MQLHVGLERPKQASGRAERPPLPYHLYYPPMQHPHLQHLKTDKTATPYSSTLCNSFIIKFLCYEIYHINFEFRHLNTNIILQKNGESEDKDFRATKT